jgi:DNA-directed RNA polymerase specialized sigma24 family protein
VNRAARDEIEATVHDIHKVETAIEPRFQEHFVNANAIPNADPSPGAEAQIVAKGEARRITDCFGTLEPARADAIRGAYLSGLSYEDLSARYDVPLNTMRSWLRRGLLKLKECLEA